MQTTAATAGENTVVDLRSNEGPTSAKRLLSLPLLPSTWIAAHVPSIFHVALLCCAGPGGEAILHNLMDDQFLERGYYHKVTKGSQRSYRDMTNHVVGTYVNRGGAVQEVRRLFTPRHPVIYPPVLLDAKVFGSGSALEAKVEGALDLSEMKPRYFTQLPPQCKLNCTHLTLPASVVTLGEYALRDCFRIVHVDLGSLGSVTSLPDGFMLGCTGLRSIKLPPNVTDVGLDAFRGCVSLITLDMSAWTGMRVVSDNFLSGCVGLESLELPPNIHTVGRGFLFGCKRLTVVDVSSWIGVMTAVRSSRVPWLFMAGCTGLQSIKFRSGQRRIQRDGDPKPALPAEEAGCTSQTC